MEHERKTTYGDAIYYSSSNEGPTEPSDPEPPKGEGWEMEGMACTERYIFWSWKRDQFRKKVFFVDCSGSMAPQDFVSAANHVASRRKEVSEILVFNHVSVETVDLDKFLSYPEEALYDTGLFGGGLADRLPEMYRAPSGVKTVFLTDGDVSEELRACFDEVVIVRRDPPRRPRVPPAP